jgi:hypothetical protein
VGLLLLAPGLEADTPTGERFQPAVGLTLIEKNHLSQNTPIGVLIFFTIFDHYLSHTPTRITLMPKRNCKRLLMLFLPNPTWRGHLEIYKTVSVLVLSQTNAAVYHTFQIISRQIFAEESPSARFVRYLHVICVGLHNFKIYGKFYLPKYPHTRSEENKWSQK